MHQRRFHLVGVALCWLLAATACSNVPGSTRAPEQTVLPTLSATTVPDVATTTDQPAAATTTAAPSTTVPPTTVPPTTVAPTTPPTTVPPTTVPPTAVAPVTPQPAIYDPACVVEVEPGDSLSVIADHIDDYTVTAATLRAENGLVGDVIQPGQLLDVCVGNGLDDVTGAQRLERNEEVVAAAERAPVVAQQRKLNTLFAGYGLNPLLVDGISGPVTRQRLCAVRASLGLPTSTNDMVPGSEEEAAMMAADALRLPFTYGQLTPRWILIDQTCQMMFVGEGTEKLVFVFPTSTGEPGHETRPQDRSAAFRFNPALDNAGWHNSTTFPVEADNPLNGNMYKPLYFDRGQAIHGANNVPTSPQSKGCARLRVEQMDLLVWWLGLGDLTGPTTSQSRINVTVNVHGAYVHPPIV